MNKISDDVAAFPFERENDDDGWRGASDVQQTRVTGLRLADC